ncbi:MAG: lysozyme [Gammaproteobacteria bacterium]|nr:lysozyme [Gammaproteobacteria bacterium]
MGRLRNIAIAAIVIAIPAEGLRRTAYYDPPGILTVCYGSTTNVNPKKVYSLTECRARLDADMMAAVVVVDKCVPNAPDGVMVAFSDAVYNLGPRIVCNTERSTAARKLKARDWVGACNELPRWNKAQIGVTMVALPGLTKRREAERMVCLQGLEVTG